MKTYQVKLNKSFIGREFEKTKLRQAIANSESSIAVVYGRRRVGKTELIEQATLGEKLLKFEGLEGQSVKQQRKVFLEQLSVYAENPTLAKIQAQSWREIFILLYEYVKQGQWIVYFEELQWLANNRIDLISDLKFVWDNYFRKNEKLTLILCGSSTSFMLKKVIKSRSLHNRALYELPVKPLSLREVKLFMETSFSLRSVFDAYLTVGGIPEYLKYVKTKSSSFSAMIEESFVSGGFFLSEFDKVFVGTIGKNTKYKSIVRAIAENAYLDRKGIAKSLKVKDGGGVSDLIDDLLSSGFIEQRRSIKICRIKSYPRECYVLKDPYLYFYSKFIYPYLDSINRGDFVDNKNNALDFNSYQQFLGFSFERFCIENNTQIAKILGFESVKYKCSPVRVLGDKQKKSFQIDLIFERADKVATVCEVKYTSAPVGVSIIEELEQKISLMPLTNNSIQKILITASGTSKELQERRYFDRIIGLEDFI